MVLFGSGFKTGAPSPLPVPVPPYTMIEIPDPPTCYALKVECTGSLTSNYIVYDPDYTSIWNMDGRASCYYGITAKVSVKWYSYSSWSVIGEISSGDPNVTNTCYDDFLSKMEFSYYDIPTP